MIEIIARKTFLKAVKQLKKRYPNISKDIVELSAILYENPKYGTDLGDGFYKIRMAISDTQKGKSSGARVITYFVAESDLPLITLLFIYDKSEISSVSKKDLQELLEYE